MFYIFDTFSGRWRRQGGWTTEFGQAEVFATMADVRRNLGVEVFDEFILVFEKKDKA